MTGDPLAELYADNLAFYDRDGRAMTCYEVLEEIARRLGARWCQWCEGADGAAWWLVSRELQTGTAYTAYYYDTAGAAETPATATVGASVDAGGAGVTRLSGTRTYRPALGAVGVLHKHGLIPPLIDEGTFDDVSTYVYSAKGRGYLTTSAAFTSNEWTYVGDAAAGIIGADTGARSVGGSSAQVSRRNYGHVIGSKYHGYSQDPDVVRGVVVASGGFDEDGDADGPNYAYRVSDDEVAEGQFLALVGSVTINTTSAVQTRYPQSYFELSFVSNDDSFTYYMRADGTWSIGLTATERAIPLTEEGATWGAIGPNRNSPFSLNFVTAAVPSGGGPVTLTLYGSSDEGVGLPGESLDVLDVEWDGVEVLIVDETGEALGATRTEAFTVDGDGMPLPDPARAEVEVILGEGPPQALPTRLTTTTAATTQALDWSSARLTTDRALDLLHAETLLRSQAKPLENRHEKYRGLAASPIAPVKVGSVYHVPQFVSLGLYHDEAEVETVELAWDASLTFTSGRRRPTARRARSRARAGAPAARQRPCATSHRRPRRRAADPHRHRHRHRLRRERRTATVTPDVTGTPSPAPNIQITPATADTPSRTSGSRT